MTEPVALEPLDVRHAAHEKAGFRAVCTFRRSYREHQSGEWRDELMMELVVP